MPFREWNFAFRESVSEFPELPREYPELSQSSENDLFTPRAFSLNWGGPHPKDPSVLKILRRQQK